MVIRSRKIRNTNQLKNQTEWTKLQCTKSLKTQCLKTYYLKLFVNGTFVATNCPLHNMVALFFHRFSNVQCFVWLSWCNNIHYNSWIQKSGSTIALNHTISCNIAPTSKQARWAIKGKLNFILCEILRNHIQGWLIHIHAWVLWSRKIIWKT